MTHASVTVTDPNNFELVGIPPVDMISAVASALRAAGLDPEEFLRKSCDITREFAYDPTAAEDIRDRIKPRFQSQKLLPVKNRTLEEVLDPQPKCSKVLKDIKHTISHYLSM